MKNIITTLLLAALVTGCHKDPVSPETYKLTLYFQETHDPVDVFVDNALVGSIINKTFVSPTLSCADDPGITLTLSLQSHDYLVKTRDGKHQWANTISPQQPCRLIRLTQ